MLGFLSPALTLALFGCVEPFRTHDARVLAAWYAFGCLDPSGEIIGQRRVYHKVRCSSFSRNDQARRMQQHSAVRQKTPFGEGESAFPDQGMTHVCKVEANLVMPTGFDLDLEQ
jgi:hypothetical protein